MKSNQSYMTIINLTYALNTTNMRNNYQIAILQASISCITQRKDGWDRNLDLPNFAIEVSASF